MGSRCGRRVIWGQGGPERSLCSLSGIVQEKEQQHLVAEMETLQEEVSGAPVPTATLSQSSGSYHPTPAAPKHPQEPAPKHPDSL